MSYNYLKQAGKILGIGRNYAAHIEELNNSIPKQPLFFQKPTSSIVTPLSDGTQRVQAPSGATFTGLKDDGTNPGLILLPKGVKVHHEVELAIVMDRWMSNVSPDDFGPEDIYDAIRGVSLALDLTARNVQDECKRKGLPWTVGKGFDTFLPISHLVPKEELIDSSNFQDSFHLKCSVNGKVRQDASTSLMLTPLHKLIQHISTVMTLAPGDIILTGTPAGVAELLPGDKIECALYQTDKPLVDMSFYCVERPGPYVYRET
ncbi:HBR503Wp [Eremothecium sinecaudum]|uniref:oxaloacetate tautomerase n=1 Tax=Eremothecium sinecaudum TaxID=45286 RepID=A0A109UXN9_9SACH|nr:HBR503Wp [Eremothecium sinecaudum]AMD19404.1 HBR503Wp [Eremothecium sinecaudum]